MYLFVYVFLCGPETLASIGWGKATYAGSLPQNRASVLWVIMRPISLPAYPPSLSGLPACLPVCLPACLPAHSPVYSNACSTDMHEEA